MKFKFAFVQRLIWQEIGLGFFLKKSLRPNPRTQIPWRAVRQQQRNSGKQAIKARRLLCFPDGLYLHLLVVFLESDFKDRIVQQVQIPLGLCNLYMKLKLPLLQTGINRIQCKDGQLFPHLIPLHKLFSFFPHPNLFISRTFLTM